MLHKLLKTIGEHAMLVPGDRLAIAVSGGADSVALLRTMLELRQQLGIVLSVVHVDHRLRAEESDRDADFVSQLATRFELPLHLTHIEVKSAAQDRRLSLEAAGRHARYDYFSKLINEGKIDKVATAHNFDDQAETVLLKFIRGAGTKGLAAIHPIVRDQDQVRIIRPMLAVSRTEIEAYLHEIQQDWREDASNSSPEFLRNRIRKDLLPLLESDFNPNIRQSLASMADIARAEQDYWNQRIAEFLSTQNDSQSLDLAAFNSSPTALQRRLLMTLAARSGHAIDFDLIESARNFLSRANSGELALSNRLAVRIVKQRQGSAHFEFIEPVVAGALDFSYELQLPGEVTIVERHARLAARRVDSSAFGTGLDMALSGQVVTVRNWRAGDRFHPAGRSPDKIKEFFQHYRVPPDQRPTWPVVEFQGEIVWVLGMPVSARHAAKASSALVIEEVAAPSTE